MIEARELSKTFFVHRKAPGLLASVRSLVRREKVAKEAVKRISFEVGEGEVVGLVGANGAGKTTVVKMLAGVIHPTSGEARVLGYVPWRRDNRFRRQIALIMGQKAQLWWDLPAADGFLLLREIYQVPPRLFDERLEKLAALLEVEEELTTQVRRLSLGERMKMELIAALLHEPRTVFLDEPTIGLDLSAQRAIRDFILAYRREHRPAMLVTSHYMEDIERLCERILILRRGELVYDGSLASVVERYARYKTITVHLAPGAPPLPAAGELGLPGRVLSGSESALSVEVPRRRVSEIAASLLQRFDVADLAIEEEAVGNIIERIQRGEAEGPA
ncbi:MAG: ATP-binding cassette domain-containing protein [Thermoanaerobaculia bacterium]|nr:ATP-binding cassette domain-containing protein [Thermoanaerobaculia bacterium]